MDALAFAQQLVEFLKASGLPRQRQYRAIQIAMELLGDEDDVQHELKMATGEFIHRPSRQASPTAPPP